MNKFTGSTPAQILLGSSLDTRTPIMTQTEFGKTRRVGVEIEFGNLPLHQAADLVVDVFGGQKKEEKPNVWSVTNTKVGDFVVELDADFLHREKPPLGASSDVIDRVKDEAYRIVGQVSASIVPVEIVAPPIPFDELSDLNILIENLRRAGGEGTGASALKGYGLHLNPEVAETKSPYLTRVLKAFLLLESSLWQDMSVDWTRRLSPFIDRFPEEYARKVIDPGYEPSLEQLIGDYLEFNPTRNRDLDLLPLFMDIAPDQIEGRVDTKLVKARPTFHYRLPDCQLDDASWNIDVEWRRWLCVEAAAADNDFLDEMGMAYVRASDADGVQSWPQQIERKLRQ